MTFSERLARLCNPPAQPVLRDVHDWLALGVLNGWCSRDFCGVHDSTPLTQDEQVEMEETGEPACFHQVRLLRGGDDDELRVLPWK